MSIYKSIAALVKFKTIKENKELQSFTKYPRQTLVFM